ncbi:hypothetical protein B0T21DRAFT_36649 [Apiosordaria backusii]|uniref:F-box domain-containing protein n=1 Tax=Apiosordaria backusii TaxID=314023 RepID=A0AA40B2P5_9PEZI|nr:hypothetical protein B0T21DRAFT_36649 [Apiosordaria backusii]
MATQHDAHNNLDTTTTMDTQSIMNVPLTPTLCGMPDLVMNKILSQLRLNDIAALRQTCKTTRQDTYNHLRRAVARIPPMIRLHGITLIRFCRLLTPTVNMSDEEICQQTIQILETASTYDPRDLSDAELVQLFRLQEVAERFVDAAFYYACAWHDEEHCLSRAVRSNIDVAYPIVLEIAKGAPKAFGFRVVGGRPPSASERARIQRGFLRLHLLYVATAITAEVALPETIKRLDHWEVEELLTVGTMFESPYRMWNVMGMMEKWYCNREHPLRQLCGLPKTVRFQRSMIGSSLHFKDRSGMLQAEDGAHTARSTEEFGFSGDDRHATEPNLAWCWYASRFPMSGLRDHWPTKPWLYNLPTYTGSWDLWGPALSSGNSTVYRCYGWVFWDKDRVLDLNMGSPQTFGFGFFSNIRDEIHQQWRVGDTDFLEFGQYPVCDRDISRCGRGRVRG